MALRFLRLVFVALFLSLLNGRFAAPSYCQQRIPTDSPCKDSMAFKEESFPVEKLEAMIDR
jgi:hypothetical protein